MKNWWLIYGSVPWVNKNLRKLKLTVILLSISAFASNANVSYGQSEKLTLVMENVTVKSILDKIESQSEFRFFFSSDLDVERKASINMKDKQIFDVLDELFKGTGIKYKVYDGQIALMNESDTDVKKAPPLQQKTGQQLTVSGKVTDKNGLPLFGVTVGAKGTTTGTITNMDGKFTLSVKEGSTLSFSMIGFHKQEFIASGTAPLEVILVEEDISLSEIVVVGYGSVKKKDITTSVSTVSVKDLAERPVISAASAIQGKAAGVNVIQPNGEPGAGMVVRIRGNSSIGASNDPLYVVDGVPMTEINFLAPNDIESMQILKDASSAAIYGSRAANGVVLITTKMGNKGETKISFSTHAGVTQVTKQIQSLNAAQYKALMDEIGAVTLPSGLTDQTDWFNETYRNGVTQDYQLSLSDATDKMRYFISGGYTDESGIIPVAYYKRYNLRANFENQIRSWFKLSTNLSYSDYTSNGIISGTGSNRAGVILSVINTPTYAPIWDPANPTHYYDNFYGAQTTVQLKTCRVLQITRPIITVLLEALPAKLHSPKI